MTQPSGAGFIAVDKILADLKGRTKVGIAWEIITEDTLAEIKHAWATLITEVLDMQAKVLRHQMVEGDLYQSEPLEKLYWDFDARRAHLSERGAFKVSVGRFIQGEDNG